jgi:hypothetical protein
VMRACVDGVSLRSAPGEGTVVTLEKRISWDCLSPGDDPPVDPPGMGGRPPFHPPPRGNEHRSLAPGPPAVLWWPAPLTPALTGTRLTFPVPLTR